MDSGQLSCWAILFHHVILNMLQSNAFNLETGSCLKFGNHLCDAIFELLSQFLARFDVHVSVSPLYASRR